MTSALKLVKYLNQLAVACVGVFPNEQIREERMDGAPEYELPTFAPGRRTSNGLRVSPESGSHFNYYI